MRMPNGFGGISKLSGNRRNPYAVRITQGWTDDGKQIVKYLGYYKTRSDALKALSAYNANPYDLSEATLTVAQVYDMWVEWLRTDKKQTVNKRYTSAYKNAKTLTGMNFRDVRKRHIQAVIDHCDKGPATKRNIKLLFSRLFQFAIDRELVTINYASLCSLPAIEASNIHKPFTAEEIARLWANVSEIGARFALVYIYTGMRPSELLQIRTENVFIDKKYMVGGIKTTAGKNRVIPIADKIMPIIKEWYNPDNDYLCMTKNGKPYDLQSMTKQVWKRSELLKDHLPHDGRHTCATLLDNAEISTKTIQLIMGHSSSLVTERVYTHKTIEQLIDAVNRI